MKRLLALLLGMLPLAAGEALADGKETLDAVRTAYYSLRREGLTGFSCLVTPNWDLMIGSRWRTDPAAAARAYKVFNGLTFGVEVSAAPHPKVTHTEAPGSDAESEPVKRVIGGIEQAVAGFFDAWRPFVMTSPIPATGTVTDVNGLKVVDFKEGAVGVRLALHDDYTIETSHITTTDFVSVIQPQFTKAPKGFLLSALQTSYRKLPDGPPLDSQLRIESQNVGGFMLPRRLHVLAYDGRAVTPMDLAFTTCQVQHR